MRWLFSLVIGLFIAWLILTFTQPRQTSYFSPAQPAPLSEVDLALISVGLAQSPQKPSIMDSINKPVPAPVHHQRVGTFSGFCTGWN
jgi:hypothetical protein